MNISGARSSSARGRRPVGQHLRAGLEESEEAGPYSRKRAASPLARRPYDLRHAAVSTWLNGGVPPTR